MLRSILSFGAQLYFHLFLAPRGYGRPVPLSTWNLQYAHGACDFLLSTDEIARYMIILGHVHCIRQSLNRLPSILDVGCGQGHLPGLLEPFGIQSYLGIDVSTEAIKAARSLGIKEARFEVGDFVEWQTAERFDIVVFNESLYYARRPAEVLRRSVEWLEPGGSIIVSLFRYAHHGLIWTTFYERFTVVNATMVQNGKGHTWDIRVLQPKEP